MRVAVLGAADSWYLRDLKRAAAGRHEVVAAAYRGLAAAVLPGEGPRWTARDPAATRDAGTVVDPGIGPDPARIAEPAVELRQCEAVVARSMPPGSLEQIVFRMDALAALEASGVPVLNPPKALEAAVDKYLTTARLDAVGVPVPRTIVCQTAAEALAAWETLGGDVVVKPLFGSEGRGITRVSDAVLAERAFRLLESLGSVCYLQEFVRHGGYDVRVLLVGEHVWGMRRSNPHDWRTNVSRGATTAAERLNDEQVDLARRAAAAVGAPLAGVDLLAGDDGRWRVLEVNAVPGWKALAATLEVDVAAEVWKFVERYVEEFGRTRRG